LDKPQVSAGRLERLVFATEDTCFHAKNADSGVIAGGR
jgi:hypothetical protein